MIISKQPRILVLGTSPKTRGGITSVIKAHKKGDFWNKYNIKWVATHIDKGSLSKTIFLVTAFLKFFYYLPSTRIIHAHLSLVNSAKRKSIFIFFAKLFNLKVIIHFHPPGHNPEYLKGNLREMYFKLFSKADIIIVLSKYWVKWLNEEIGIYDNIQIINNPCPEINPMMVNKNQTILFAGSIIERKGYRDLIKAFAQISKKHDKWKLILAGNGDIEKGEKLAQDLEIANKVIFTGWLTGEDKSLLFSSSSIFCLPSYGEGFPMAILEAWSYGLPIISTEVGGLVDILKDGINSLTCNPGDINDLTFKLDLMISDSNLRKSICQESQKLVQNEFNLKNINKKIGIIYSNLLTES